MYIYIYIYIYTCIYTCTYIYIYIHINVLRNFFYISYFMYMIMIVSKLDKSKIISKYSCLTFSFDGVMYAYTYKKIILKIKPELLA